MIICNRLGSKINFVPKLMPLQLNNRMTYKYFNIYQWSGKSNRKYIISNSLLNQLQNKIDQYQ